MLRLNTWQRVTLINLIGGLKGPVAMIRKAGKLLDILEFTKDEQEQINLLTTPKSTTWKNEVETWVVEIADSELMSFLTQRVKGYDGWLVGDHVMIVDLCEKLGIE